jgi:cysteine sulfinate desulfinase/cysteine desulfurase-like protein
MGLSEDEMEGAIRFSFNGEITDEALAYAVQTIIDSVKSLSKIIKGR